MRLMMVAGGIVSGSSDADLDALATYGECLGKAYQIYDDLADAMGDRESTGKSVGQDSRHRRPSIIKGLDREESRKLATGIIEAGKDALLRFGDRNEANLLRSAAGYIVGCFNPATFSSERAVQVARDQGTDAERSR